MATLANSPQARIWAPRATVEPIRRDAKGTVRRAESGQGGQKIRGARGRRSAGSRGWGGGGGGRIRKQRKAAKIKSAFLFAAQPGRRASISLLPICFPCWSSVCYLSKMADESCKEKKTNNDPGVPRQRAFCIAPDLGEKRGGGEGALMA